MLDNTLTSLRTMHDFLLLLHFAGLVIGAGSAFALFCIGQLVPRFDPAYRGEVLVRLFVLRYISYAGLLLLILSGLALLGPYLPLLTAKPLLQLKLILVLLLAGVSAHGLLLMRKGRRDGAAAVLPRLKLLGKISLMLTIAILVCAVYSFH